MSRHTKRILTIVFLAVFFANQACGYYELANSRKRGLRHNSIETILQLDDDKIDLATAVLVLSRDWGTTKTLHSYRRKIDLMAQEILRRAEQKQIQHDAEIIPLINEYLFSELGFKSVETADNPEDLFLHSVIDKKRGYCLSLSVLYLSIAERIGLPLYGVVVPGHFFVRYDDGEIRFNIETTSDGRNASDKHYKDKFKPPAGEDSVYMKNLTNRQTLGCFFNNLGNSYSIIQELDYAQIELERAVTVTPNLAEGHTNLGNTYLTKGFLQDALYEYAIAIDILPTDPKTHNNMANAYNQLGEPAKAIVSYKRAIKIDRNFSDAHRNLAGTYLGLSSLKKALSEIKKARKIDPKDPATQRLLGDIYSSMNKFDLAIPAYRKALKLNPNDAGACTNLGYAYLNNSQTHDAVSWLTIAIQLEPLNTNAYFGLANAYNKLGQLADEITTYQQLLEIQPNAVVAMQNLGNAYMNQKSFDDAVETYIQAIALAPENPDIYYNLGVAYINLNLFADAIAQYDKTIELSPKNAAAYNGLAIGYYMMKNKEMAQKHARTATKLGFKVQKKLLDAIK
ncbi:MAG: tetratricopeptide repeat protein [Planctomycetes bacterium]|nr:tetratricopeptide repeat protein [Planctomycetota bacterium]